MVSEVRERENAACRGTNKREEQKSKRKKQRCKKTKLPLSY